MPQRSKALRLIESSFASCDASAKFLIFNDSIFCLI